MEMQIETNGARLGTLERIHMSRVLGTIDCHFDQRLRRATVSVRPDGARRRGRMLCRIDLASDSGTLSVEGSGPSPAAAFMRASEGLERALFAHFFRRTEAAGSDDSPTRLAA